MLHIKDLKQSSESKKKFWQNNADLFLKYLPSQAVYEAKINNGKFDELEQARKEQSKFCFETWCEYLAADKLAEFKL